MQRRFTPFSDNRIFQQTQGATWQTGQDTVVRAQFINNGKLANTADNQFRAVSDRWPVFAFAHDLGSVRAATTPTVFAIGHVRDPAVQYITANNGRQNRSYYFWTRFSSVASAVCSKRSTAPSASR